MRVLVSDYDSYQHVPTKIDYVYGRAKQTPVIRVYGSVRIPPAGPKRADPVVVPAMVHVHNYFPYFYVECLEKDEARWTDSAWLETQAKKLDEQVATGPGASSSPLVLRVAVVKGLPIYGYIPSYRPVYKVTLTNPQQKTRVAGMFHAGTARLDDGGRKPLVYEAHIPYTAQFMADFNVFGCGWMEVTSSRVRSPPIGPNVLSPAQLGRLREWLLDEVVAKDNVLDPLKWPRIGRSVLEFDCDASAIGNRKAIELRRLHDGFREWEDYKLLQKSPCHGYRFHDGKPVIFLASLTGVYADLEYQCRLRDQPFSASVDHGSEYYGMGQSVWSNQSELDSLLEYAIRQNGATNVDMKVYEKRFCRDYPVPTCFESVDLDAHHRYHSYAMRMGSDLVQWRSARDLFAVSETSDDGQASTVEDSVVENSVVEDEELVRSASSGSDWFSDDDLALLLADDVPRPKEPSFEFPREPSKEPEGELEKRLEEGLVDESDLEKKLEEGLVETESDSEPVVDDDVEVDTAIVTQRPFQLRSSFFSSFSSDSSEPPGTGGRYRVPIPSVLSDPVEFDREFIAQGMLKIDWPVPTYDNPGDVPERAFVFSNRRHVVPVNSEATLPVLPMSSWLAKTMRQKRELRRWRYVRPPPEPAQVAQWLETEHQSQKYASQIEAISQVKFSYNSLKVERQNSGYNAMTYFYLDVHASTTSSSLPNAERDAVTAAFFYFDDGNGMYDHTETVGSLVVGQGPAVDHVQWFASEQDLVARLLALVTGFDPDILAGYEVNARSWGYLIERWRKVHDVNLMESLGRGTFKAAGKFGDRWGYTHTSNIQLNGRHVLNVWRVLRSDMALTNYSLENVCAKLLKVTLPRFTNWELSRWVASPKRVLQAIGYYMRRLEVVVKIITVQELVTRNVEYSRLIGIDFNANFYRGSQFKVESILMRLSKAENVILNSPSKQDVHEMRSLEHIPLILEPDSSYYRSPLVVLDFQSLYPSIIIAYNYCYSTMFCRLRNYRPTKSTMGYLNHHYLPPGVLDLLAKRDALNVAPNGVVFCKSSVRKSVIAKMLEELLDTRQAVKKVMKLFSDSELTKLYNARQLALKLIANVTYGYASASFSGRMPNSDVADSIVATGREILTNSIDMINKSEYGAKVVYGDTDSLFVYFPGQSREDAFRHGKLLAERVTKSYPDPIFLKFEKVYHPSVLLAKKRYVGYAFSDEWQKKPAFDAKGIETVRRDGIPAQGKMLEKSLRILFDTANLSDVKRYVLKQFSKIHHNKVAVPDFCFAKEVRYGTYKDERYLPPGAIVAQKAIDQDPRAEPQYRERIPYVIYYDPTKPRIKDRAVSPEEFIKSGRRLDYEYYITRVLSPPLERIFNLMGADVKGWYSQLPKVVAAPEVIGFQGFLKRHQCVVCGRALDQSEHFCRSCLANEAATIGKVMATHRAKQRKFLDFMGTCNTCVSNNVEGARIDQASECCNQSCQVYFERIKTGFELEEMEKLHPALVKELEW
ncbi:DNA polymerase zeta catalytic subunit [Diutina catenulata]